MFKLCDDWDDAPFQYNAGIPYGELYNDHNKKGTIIKIAFESDLEIPSNKRYICVNNINNKENAWLYDCQFKPVIWAGISLQDFVKIIKDLGGEIYLSETLLNTKLTNIGSKNVFN